MKVQSLIAFLAVALGTAMSNLASAQGVQIQQQISPSEGVRVGWSSPASLCRLLPGSAQSIVDYADGAVTFAPGASGTIGLICSIPGVANGFFPEDMEAFSITFSDPNSKAGCDISAYIVDRTTQKVNGLKIHPGVDYKGVWTADVDFATGVDGLEPIWPIVANHTYDVDVYLSRSQAAGNMCNPVAFGLFLDDIALPF